MKKDTPKNTKELKKQMKKDEKKALEQDVLKLKIECHKTMKTISDCLIDATAFLCVTFVKYAVIAYAFKIVLF